jgi:nitrogen fixation protein FixH
VIEIKESRMSVIFPENQKVQQGTITLFRPSSDKLDQNFTLSPSSDSVRIFALQPLEPGAYRIKMTWTAEGKEFYFEKYIVI